MEEFDSGEHKPKFLSCHHTLCLMCSIKSSYHNYHIKDFKLNLNLSVQAIAKKSNLIPCPDCRTVSHTQGGAVERLASNMYVLDIIQLKKLAVKRKQQLDDKATSFDRRGFSVARLDNTQAVRCKE